MKTKPSKMSIKPMLNIRSSTKDDRYTLVIQLLHARKRSVIFTPYRLLPEEFDRNKARAVATNQRKVHRQYIAEVNSFLERQLMEIQRLLTDQEREGKTIDVTDITQAYRHQYDNRYMHTFFQAQIAELEKQGKHGTAASYHSTLVCFEKFAGNGRIHFDNVDAKMLLDFESYLRQIPLQPNTVTFYMSNFRAMYNKARKKGYVARGASPFEMIPLRIEKTRKLAVSPAVIRKVAGADLSDDRFLSCARDLFMFSFYCRGMSFVDMAYLKKEDIRDGVIYYRRHKTGQLYSIKIIPPLQQIIDRYRKMCAPWVLPVMLAKSARNRIEPLVYDENSAQHMHDFNVLLHKRYKYSLSHYLRYLERLTKRLKLEKKLTFNMARHSWASMARNTGIPVSVISVGLGHTSEKTTQIYLDDLDHRKIDEANEAVASLLSTNRRGQKNA